MVKEHRYVFDIGDIDSLIFSCRHCSQEVACKLDGEYHPYTTCPSCNEQLLPRGQMDTNNPHVTLLINMRRILKLSDPKVRLRFVVPEPDQEKA